MSIDSINKGYHYRNVVITENLVGMQLDPALIAELYNVSPLLLQALKKLLLAGNRGLKNREDDLIGVISAVQRQLEIDKCLNPQNKDVPF